MKYLLVAAALLAACRGGKAPVHDDAGPLGSASSISASVVPKLPRSEDGNAELGALDRRIELHADDLAQSITLRLERAGIRGRLEDYETALAMSATLVKQKPADEQAWRLRVEALLRVHEFANARDALKQLARLVHPSTLVGFEITLAEARGDAEQALVMRADVAKQAANAQNLTLWAAALAQAGLCDEAVEIIPRAAAAVRDNPPQLLAWLLFQWGRIYELKGELGTAREFFAAARARMPGHLEATAHLVQTLIGTGDTVAARKLVDEALAEATPPIPADAGSVKPRPHPELLALAAQLGHAELVETARAEWERYVATLPLAFADHAARFYLGIGKNPTRALELARINLDNRQTREARALLVEAALAASNPAMACAEVDPLVNGGTRGQRFVAWQALSRCGRSTDADRLARELGIVR
jgi:tetratricopeptide (TPR) repeat protein